MKLETVDCQKMLGMFNKETLLGTTEDIKLRIQQGKTTDIWQAIKLATINE